MEFCGAPPPEVLPERTFPQTLSFTFSATVLKWFSHSNSWVSLSAMLSLGQATFQGWPPKPDTGRASSIMQSPSLAHLWSYPPTRLSFTASWNTTLSTGLDLLPHIFLSLTLWKSSPLRSLDSPVIKLSLWVYDFHIADMLLVSLSSSASFLVLHPLPSLWSVHPMYLQNACSPPATPS